MADAVGSSGRPHSPNRLQPRLDRRAAQLEEGPQRELLVELVHRLTRRKARAVGDDLEQDAIGFAEIEATKKEAVDLAAVEDAKLRQPLGPGVVLRASSGVRKASWCAPPAPVAPWAILLRSNAAPPPGPPSPIVNAQACAFACGAA